MILSEVNRHWALNLYRYRWLNHAQICSGNQPVQSI